MTISPPKVRHAAIPGVPPVPCGPAGIPTLFCRSDAPNEPFVRPFMDLDTGDSFEHTDAAAHPNAMENIQLKSAHEAFVAAKRRNMTTREALVTLKQHTLCSLTCESMEQPVRAPDNILYEADALMKSIHTWKPLSPSTRVPFPEHLTLTVDRRMQQLSAACGIYISQEKLALTRMQVKTRHFAPSLEAAEEGRADAPARARQARWVHAFVCLGEGAVAGAAMRALGISETYSVLGVMAVLVGVAYLPVNLHQTWEQLTST